MKQIFVIFLTITVLLNSGTVIAVNAANSDLIQEEFPLYQSAVIKRLGGDIKGFGLLAYYESASPEKVYIKRTTQIPQNEALVDEVRVCVYDPEGSLAAFYILPNTEAHEYVLNIPSGAAGIWRISVSGGREGDVVDIGLPDTKVWGIRGEMALGITETTPKEAYIYMAKTTNHNDSSKWHRSILPSGYLFGEAMKVNSSSCPSLALCDEYGNLICETAVSENRYVFSYSDIVENSVMKLKITGNEGAIVLDGTPGLLCPTKEAAEILKGGTAISNGFTLAGPLQARIREQMIELYNEGVFEYDLVWPESIPEDADLMREVLFYGKHSPISDIDMRFEKQVLDIDDPYFGQVISINDDGAYEKLYSANGLATAAVQYGAMNPAYQKQSVINRALLNGLAEMVFAQGDSILRVNQYMEKAYPISDLFFAYNQITDTYSMLNQYMDEELKAVWREMMLSIGDKAAYIRCFQSNQWIHMINAHLTVYASTGEERFLNYFNNQINAYIDNTYGPSSKFGQHEAGYFLEEYAPDGNYQSLNLYMLINCYNTYEKIVGKDSLSEKIKNSINKALDFNSLYWLRQPDGTIKAPTHMNGRTTSSMGSPNFPADYMAKADFGQGLTRWLMGSNYISEKSGLIGSYIVSDEEWARRVIAETLPYKGHYCEKSFMYSFVGLFEAYSKPQVAVETQIPTDSMCNEWELPGQLAWKRGSLYGMVFYDVEGSSANIPMGIMGGAPSVFWSEGVGNSVCSVANGNTQNMVSAVDDLTFSCCYKENADQSITHSGKAHTEFEDKGNGKYCITEEFDGKTLTWEYNISDEFTEIAVELSDNSNEDYFLNLPFLNTLDGVEMSFETDNVFKFAYRNSAVLFEGVKGAMLSDDISGGTYKVRCLRIPFENNKITIRVYTQDTYYYKNGKYKLLFDFDNTDVEKLKADGMVFAGIPSVEDGALKLTYNPYILDENGEPVYSDYAGRCYVELCEAVDGCVVMEADYTFFNNDDYKPKRHMLMFGIKEGNTEVYEPVSVYYGVSTGNSAKLHINDGSMEILEGETINLKLIIDFDLQIYFVYINGEYKFKKEFQTDLVSFDRIRFLDSYGSSNGQHINVIDNFYVWSADKEVKTNGKLFGLPIEHSSDSDKNLQVLKAGKVFADTVVENMSANSETCTMYTALYSSGILEKVVSSEELILSPYTRGTLKTVLDVDCIVDENTKLKSFVWYGNDGIKPLILANEI